MQVGLKLGYWTSSVNVYYIIHQGRTPAVVVLKALTEFSEELWGNLILKKVNTRPHTGWRHTYISAMHHAKGEGSETCMIREKVTYWTGGEVDGGQANASEIRLNDQT